MNKRYIIITILFFSISAFSQKPNTLKVGDQIPRFFLEDQNGIFFDSDDFLGEQPLVIFFYPKAGAPVCTAEACSFRDNITEFKQLNTKIVGISPDDTKNQQNFTKENNLPYQVLSDKNNRVRKLFGVPTLFLSKRPKRYTFVVDKNGVVQKIYYNKKDVDAHIEESLITLYKETNNEFTVKK